MNRFFWRELALNAAAPSDGATLDELTTDLVGFLSSNDPELRDDFGFSILSRWILMDAYTVAQLRGLINKFTDGLVAHIGELETDSIFGRSFSALMLSVIVKRENQNAFLTPPEIEALLAHGLAYLNAERDLRGYVITKGWAHSVAHTADLICNLACNKNVGSSSLQQILEGISVKLTTARTPVLLQQEPTRLANAASAVIRRELLDVTEVEAWLHWLFQTLAARSQSDLESGDVGSRVNCEAFLAALSLTLESGASAVQLSIREAIRRVMTDFGFIAPSSR